MLNVAGMLYLGSRVTAAAGNLLAVMIFTRLAGAGEYGHYLLIFAWTVIVYGFGAQWMRYAYFGVFHPKRFDEYVGSLARLLGSGLLIVALVLAALGGLGLFAFSFLFAVFGLVCGTTVYEAAFEVARTQLNARAAALSMFLRTTLTLAFGSASLWLGGGAPGLALAIAAANVLAALPSIATFAGARLAPASRAASLHIVSYGWPLLISFGVNAAGGSVDRLLIAHYAGDAALGSYGVVADVMRQSFIVFGEAIMLSLVTVAKRHANDGDFDAANGALQKAFNGCLAAASLGAAFFVVFGEPALHAILQPQFVAPVRNLIPLFAMAFAFMTMRSFYFGQVIYFTRASYLDLVVSLVFLVVSIVLSLLLIPSHGLEGAAIALMTANVLACVAFVVLGRRWYKLPVDPTAVGVIPALAVIFVFGAQALDRFFAGGLVPLAVDAVGFGLCVAFAVLRFGLLKAVPAASIGRAVPAR